MDQIYTPQMIAERMVSFATCTNPKFVADFSAGEGSLLEAASNRWPNAKLIASDIDEKQEVFLRSIENLSAFVCADFLAPEGQFLLASEIKPVDLVILNPPFSNRGATRYSVAFGDKNITTSKAFAFVIHSLKYLNKSGQVLAIVPLSCLHSEADKAAREQVKKNYSLEVLDVLKSAFRSHAVQTAIIRISKRQDLTSKDVSVTPSKRDRLPFSIRIMRGTLSMPDKYSGESDKLHPLIHTTCLQNGRVENLLSTNQPSRTVSGAVVLLPRVGRPNVGKIVQFEPQKPVTISDCVIALQTNPIGFNARLFGILVENWENLSMIYQASCASYTSLQKLANFLENLGSECEVVTSFAESKSAKESICRSQKRSEPENFLAI
jgi:predicted RNA methylase